MRGCFATLAILGVPPGIVVGQIVNLALDLLLPLCHLSRMAHPLAIYRIKHGLTQAELAALLGVSKSIICRWEARARTPKPQKLLEISRMTGVDLVALLEAEPAE